jgi:NADPH-dependent 2,4-dienoyl-CoA reductase/sulfur reductase-like enzyme/Fe-S-cluster-containing hydrogenase component 2/bacterioferritin-associated ferredoxin
MKQRITSHPILPIEIKEEIPFMWNNQSLTAFAGETIAAALMANDIKIFGHHHKDNSPQSIYCANGQCSQCMVIANGKPVKSCMELIQPDMQLFPAEGLPTLPISSQTPQTNTIEEIKIPVLIMGGGPAGLSAGIELGKFGMDTILIDDKHRLGGKLVLQTHRFFGSTAAVYAGTRGIDIAAKLDKEIRQYPTVQIWLESTILAVYSDQKVGVLKNNSEYVHIIPEVILVATGAREKFLAFKGNSLPGVFGAGAFQTLVNRDLIKPAEKIFIVGGGNVGLIAGYHALQAGISVVGLVEALPECGGYKVHKDKLIRMGVPIYTSHTILSANGSDHVESVTIAEIDPNFTPIPGTEKSFECDCVLTAVGLSSVDEFYDKANEFGLKVFIGGDAEEIAEASAAIFSGKIKGHEIAQFLGVSSSPIPSEWLRMSNILKSKPGSILGEESHELHTGVTPVIHCVQEIPCDPCANLCPNGLIIIDASDIRSTPTFIGNTYSCLVCERCVAGCPGLAITLVDYRSNPAAPFVSIPYEFNKDLIQSKDIVTVLDREGNALGKFEVMGVHSIPSSDRTLIVQVQAPEEIANKIAGIQLQDREVTQPLEQYVSHISDDTIVCRCERVTAGEIRTLIQQGYRDMNEIKTVSRAGMGACGGKTCSDLIHRIFREEGIALSDVVDQTKRPVFIEVPLGIFAGIQPSEEEAL